MNRNLKSLKIMKNPLPLLCIAALTLPVISVAMPDSTRIEAAISVRRADPGKWTRRHQSDIDRYTDLNRGLEDRSCDVLFLGSSSINLWPDIEKDFAPLKVIRRSYGGSTIRDQIYNYDVVARDFTPRDIVLYVENDLTGGDKDVTVGEAYDLFRVFISKLRADHPRATVRVLSLKPSVARERVRSRQQQLNTLLSDYAAATPGVEYVDITAVMYDSSGEVRREIFTDDNLHMNRAGYDLWLGILKPLLVSK
jgi:hypothetical protein